MAEDDIRADLDRPVISGLLDQLAGLASPWGYVLVGLLALLEASAMIGLFVPGEAALLVGGFLASQQRADLRVMMLVAAVGAIAGDSIGYEIGKHFGPRFRISRLGRWVGDARWARAEDYLAHHGGRAVFFGRFVGVLRAMVPTIAGLSRMPYRTFLPWNAIGGLIWAPGFVLLGYVAGGSYDKVAHWAGRASTVLLLLVVLVAGVVLTARAVVRREGAVRMWLGTQVQRPAVASVVRRFERQLAYVARRLRPNGAFGLSLTVALGGLALVGWAFGIVVEDVISRNDLAGLDGTVYRFFLEHRAPDLTSASRAVAALGRPAVLLFIALVVGGLVGLRTRRPRDVLLPLLAAGGSWMLVELIATAVNRPPPPISQMLAGAPAFSFPSGQSARAVACFMTLAFVGSGALGTWRGKVVVVTSAFGASLLIGLSDLALAVTWFTDVLGGWALGTLWFGVVVVVNDVVTSLRQRGREVTPASPPSGC